MKKKKWILQLEEQIDHILLRFHRSDGVDVDGKIDKEDILLLQDYHVYPIQNGIGAARRWYLWAFARENCRKCFRVHRLILGKKADGFRCIDHRNFDGMDNRKSNLMPTDHRGNGWNRFKPAKSGFHGVHCLKNGKFEARTSMMGEYRYLGCFQLATDAAKCVHDFLRQHVPQFNILDGLHATA